MDLSPENLRKLEAESKSTNLEPSIKKSKDENLVTKIEATTLENTNTRHEIAAENPEIHPLTTLNPRITQGFSPPYLPAELSEPQEARQP